MQVLQQPLMQRSAGGEIPAGAPPQPHVRQGELRADKRLPRCACPSAAPWGWVPLIEARDGFLRLLQAAPSRHFHRVNSRSARVRSRVRPVIGSAFQTYNRLRPVLRPSSESVFFKHYNLLGRWANPATGSISFLSIICYYLPLAVIKCYFQRLAKQVSIQDTSHGFENRAA